MLSRAWDLGPVQSQSVLSRFAQGGVRFLNHDTTVSPYHPHAMFWSIVGVSACSLSHTFQLSAPWECSLHPVTPPASLEGCRLTLGDGRDARETVGQVFYPDPYFLQETALNLGENPCVSRAVSQCSSHPSHIGYTVTVLWGHCWETIGSCPRLRSRTYF